MNLNDRIKTPRFLTVRITAMFDSMEDAESAGYTEGTDYRDESWHIRGKHTGENRMRFAAVARYPES